MGKEVVYCFNCGVRLLYSDFEKGAAFRVKQECACAKCMPLLLEMLPPEEREEFQRRQGSERPGSATPRRGTGRVPMAEGARRSTTRRTRPAGAVPAEEPSEEETPPPSRRRAVLLVSVGAGLLVGIAGLVLLLTRTKADVEVVEEVEKAKPPVREIPKPPTPEEAAREALRKAREYQARNSGDLEGQLLEFQEVAWKYDKTAAAEEARREAAAIREKMAKGLTPEMESLLARIKEPLDAEEYGKALEILDRAKDGDVKPAWILQVDKRIEEVRGDVAKKHEEAKQKAREAKERGDTAAVAAQRERVVKWGIPRLIEEFDAAFGGPMEEVKKAPPPPPAGRSEEGKAYLAKWKEAVAPATGRDYAEARRRLEEAARGLAEEATKKEAEEDLRDLREVEEFYKGALKAVLGWGAGQAVEVEVVTPGGTREAVKGVVAGKEEDHLEVRKEGRKEATFVEPQELSGTSLAKAAQGEGAPSRAGALFLLLEGEAEAARKAEGVEVPEKYREYAKAARERPPREAGIEARKEREAKRLYWGAEKEWGRMETLGGAIEKYKALAKEYVGTEIARKHIERITVRSEGGKEYFLLAGDLEGSGAVGLRAHPELESCWTCREDVGEAARARETYVEVEFHALPQTPYLCWVYAGACCEETFLFYLQATDMVGPNPRKRSEQIPYDVGGGVAAPVEPKVRGLKRTHAQHGGEKQAARWEWIPVPLPKYANGGLKKVRLMTEQKGFSVAMALVSSVRKAPPKEAELGEDLKRAREEAKGRARPDPSLVGHWKLDEGGADASGQGNHGKVTGSPKVIAGRVGSALEFQGRNDCLVTVPSSPSLKIAGDLTIALFVRKNAESPEWVRLVGKGGQQLRNYGVWEEEKGGKKILFQQYNSANQCVLAVTSAGTIELGRWTHVACVIQGNRAFVYVNGELSGQGTRSGAPATSEDPLTIGHGLHHSPLSGALDDVRVYNRALTPEEIKALSQGLGP